MSGIAAILRLDGGPPGGLDAMCRQLSLMGPDGTRMWQTGPCALGQTLLATTPEAMVEQLPLTHAPSGCTITADARIDNRDDLLTRFGLANAGRVIGDGELILQAWLTWGPDCPRHLMGDFAFVIRDPRTQTLFAARDQMGMKRLAWGHQPGRVFACATDPQAVLLAVGMPRRLNIGRVADALEHYLEAIDKTETFFTGIHRLPPAHSLIAGPNGVQTGCYWRPEPRSFLHLPSDAAYAEAFRDVMSTAVRRRLRAPPGQVGSMLSGGMDSATAVALAARMRLAAGDEPLPTFSGVAPDPETSPETAAIQMALGMPHIVPTVIDWSALGPLGPRLVAALDRVDEPFDTHMNMIRALCMAAADRGVRVLLNGVAGDVVLNAGAHARWLMHGGRLVQLAREIRGLAAFHGPPWGTGYFLNQALRQGLAPLWLRRMAFARRQSDAGRPTNGLLSPAGAARVDLANRARRWAAWSKPARRTYLQDRVERLLHPSLTVGTERYDRVASQQGIECRDPYTDREVVDFCLSLPPLHLQRDGWPKWVQRQATAGLVPDSIRWKAGRDHVGWQFSESVYRAAIAATDPPDAAETTLALAGSRAFDLNLLRVNPVTDRLYHETDVNVSVEILAIHRFLVRLAHDLDVDAADGPADERGTR
jgi:asparagine synthase (glutamine-hydrolysing)